MSHEILVPIFAFCSVVGIGGSVITAIAARRKPLKDRLLGLEEESDAGPHRSLNWVASLGSSVAGKGPSRTLQQDLAQAGYHGASAPAVFLGIKVLVFAGGTAAGVLAFLPLTLSTPLRALLGLTVGVAFSFLPNLVVKIRREKRRSDVRRYLPDAIDLLEICVSAGMGLDMAWNAVAAEIRHVSPILADEMALTNLEMHLGAERAASLRNMAERTGADEVSSLVATLVQSEKFGTSISDALKVFADSMRVQRSQKAEEAAEKMAVKLIFPMVVFLFPAMLIVMVGPAFIIIARTLGDG